jgi:hypothetical protein
MDEEPELSSTESISADDEAILTDYLERHGLKALEAPPVQAEDLSDKTAKEEEPEDKT